ncbi:MAG: hypothetical protein ABSG28_10265 [Methanoregula sp.]|uniref:hypothetical protein n=1 Tax=Methanoregula sp. TaxID=2052170 RepID=UPI003C22E95C
MRRSLFIGLSLIIGIVLLCTGCTSAPGTQTAPAPIATAPTANVSLAPLALGPADIPAGFVLQTSRQKSADEVSSLARDLGWQQGYITVYSTPENSTGGSSVITQTVTEYSGQNMSRLVSFADTGEHQQKGLVFADLPVPATGPDTRAYAASVANATPVSSSTGGNMAMLAEDSGTSAPTVGYVEVIFARGNILDVIRMSGPGAQYDTLKALAETAYAKFG